MVTTVHITPPPLSPQAMADLLCTIVVLCQGRDKYNRNFWAYMCVKPSMAESFRKARESGTLHMGDYGTIIEAGEGSEPPEEVRARMERDYGVRQDYDEQLLRAIETVKRRSGG